MTFMLTSIFFTTVLELLYLLTRNVYSLFRDITYLSDSTLTSCVTPNKLHNISSLSFLIGKMEVVILLGRLCIKVFIMVYTQREGILNVSSDC